MLPINNRAGEIERFGTSVEHASGLPIRGIVKMIKGQEVILLTFFNFLKVFDNHLLK